MGFEINLHRGNFCGQICLHPELTEGHPEFISGSAFFSGSQNTICNSLNPETSSG
jgi:hypothetical protein